MRTVRYGEQLTRDEVSTPGPIPSLQDVSLLVVDDNETNRRILYEMTGRWGMKPLAVDGGLAALAAVEEAGRRGERFRVILMDANMPGMDG